MGWIKEEVKKGTKKGGSFKKLRTKGRVERKMGGGGVVRGLEKSTVWGLNKTKSIGKTKRPEKN